MLDKPRVLIFGGCGFIGRNLVSYLVDNDLVTSIRIVDKVPPPIAWLNNKHKESINNSIVEVKSANLINRESCRNAFMSTENWDIVINCAAEIRPGQTDPVYNEGILKLSLNCAQESVANNAKRYIELSSAYMYSSDSVPHKESDPTQPWTSVSLWKLQVEKELSKIPNLNYTILRLPIVYGSGDRNGLFPRILLAGLYKYLKEPMKVLWGPDLKLNTVHVLDVCRAIWFVSQNNDAIKQVYNVVDDADSTQGSISKLLEDLFEIKIEYYGNFISSAIDLTAASEEANDKHLIPWAELCIEDDVQNTPLTPYMNSEALIHKQLYIDGAKLKDLGFRLEFPKPTCELLKNIIDEYVAMKIYPPSLCP